MTDETFTRAQLEQFAEPSEVNPLSERLAAYAVTLLDRADSLDAMMNAARPIIRSLHKVVEAARDGDDLDVGRALMEYDRVTKEQG